MLPLTNEMLMVLAILAYTILMFITEVIRIDVAALLILVMLGLSGLVPDTHLFDGFASNAVISIIAVMILGAGLDRTGVMSAVANFILKIGGKTEKTVMPVVSLTVGSISGFMQNVGATALFLPVMSKISSVAEIPISRLLMPMGFCAILGGTVTMVGSSPLILLNDLIETSNRSLPPGADTMPTFSLFATTPIGLALLLSGIVYFLVLGRFLLPKAKEISHINNHKSDSYFRDNYGIEKSITEMIVNRDSPLVGKMIQELEFDSHIPHIVALSTEGESMLSPPRSKFIWNGAILGVMGSQQQINDFAEEFNLTVLPRLKQFKLDFNPAISGTSEAVVVPGSRYLGVKLSEFHFRKEFAITILAVSRNNRIYTGEEMYELELQLGDTFIIHGRWTDQMGLGRSRNVALVSDVPAEPQRPQKIPFALLFFALSISLVILTDLKLSLSLLTGAIGMIIFGVLNMDEAYRAVSWKTVFLLACLIPLGYAMEHTGTAAWIAQYTIHALGDVHQIVYQLAMAGLATLFSLVMSNVGATVLLVPLAINIAIETGGNPLVYALIVAISTSNAFLLPTHQVSALVMGPGGYGVKDYLKVGSLMTLIFLAVSLPVINWLF
ncbi:SLC13 family permease [Marinicella sediminis]|uniref:SLC13 family permease n=1 Tax=Marinicella sediminis TaxID=1792834 RepID=A0ABV7JBB0_9GAMM|nr:SLC13 family permease [Marinicella sediminis]